MHNENGHIGGEMRLTILRLGDAVCPGARWLDAQGRRALAPPSSPVTAKRMGRWKHKPLDGRVVNQPASVPNVGSWVSTELPMTRYGSTEKAHYRKPFLPRRDGAGGYKRFRLLIRTHGFFAR